MIEWRLESSTLIDHWNVAEYDSRGAFRRYIVTDLDKPTASRVAKLLELETIIAKLPETKDGIHVLPGDTVWSIAADGTTEERVVLWATEAHPWPGYSAGFGVEGPPIPVEDCYSTLEAAEAAREAVGS